MAEMTRWWTLALASSVFVGAAIASFGDCANAQITPDGTLGAENSVVTRTSTEGLPTDRIDGGATRGANLFHSFEEFSVPTGSAAYFNNALNIQNIFSRVTGGSISNIDGLLRANGTANLFLINPNGIIFGPNASLNIGGSFVGTTANAIGFGNQGFFSASAPDVPPLLAIKPDAFFFNQVAAGPITINSRRVIEVYPDDYLPFLGPLYEGLKVPDGQSLLLLGGNVSLNGGILQAPGGRVELGGLADSGTIGLNMNGNDWLLSFPLGAKRADIYLLDDTSRDISGAEGDRIIISTQNLNISDSFLSNDTNGLGDVGTGSILLQANGSIFIDNSYIGEKRYGFGFTNSGNATNLFIQANRSVLINDSEISSTAFQGEDSGDVSVQANGSVFFADVEINTYGNGDGGNVSVQANDSVSFTSSNISSFSFGKGDTGSVLVQANGSVSFTSSRIFTDTFFEAKGGDINIQARSVSIKDSQVAATTSGSGKAGNIQIDAIDYVMLSGDRDGLFTNTDFLYSSRPRDDSVGQGGDITVRTGALRILDKAVLSARTRTDGDGGNITVNVNTLEIAGGGKILTTAFSNGDAGVINVNAIDSITISGNDPTYSERQGLSEITVGIPLIVVPASPASGLFANSVEGSRGQGGSLRIETGTLNIRDRAEVNVSSAGAGAAGDLTVLADSIRLDNQGSILATTAAGNQGNITLRSQNLVLRRSSNITTDAQATATGGNITIDTDILAALENSDITANALEGPGGRVIINAQGIFGTEFRDTPTPESDITATSELGPEFSGTVEINTPDVDPSLGLVELPVELVDTSRQIATTCEAGGENEFIVTGRGGLPPSPTDPLSSDTIWSDLRTFTQQAETKPSSDEATNSTNSAPTQIVEATGWVINNKGEVVLTDSAPNATPHNPWMNPANCHTSQSTS